MLAKVSASPASAEYELLTAPHSLRAQSSEANLPFPSRPKGPHADGCGVAWLDGNTVKVEKQGRDHCWDSVFSQRAKALASSALIAHNRAASPGLVIEKSAAHPYLGSIGGAAVAFCHNGGVRSLFDSARSQRVTDSFLFLKHVAKEVHVLDLSSLRTLLANCSRDWSYSSLNGLLLSRQGVYAWRCFEESGSSEINDKYYTLHVHRRKTDICLASEPVDQKRGWESLPNRTIVELRSERGAVIMNQATF